MPALDARATASSTAGSGPRPEKSFGRELDQIEEPAASLDVQCGPGQSPGLRCRRVAGADGNQWGGGDRCGHEPQPNHTVLTADGAGGRQTTTV